MHYLHHDKVREKTFDQFILSALLSIFIRVKIIYVLCKYVFSAMLLQLFAKIKTNLFYGTTLWFIVFQTKGWLFFA